MGKFTQRPAAFKPNDDGQPDQGDAFEGHAPAPADFDPAKLEATADGSAFPDRRPAADATAGPALDPFDPAALRLSQDFGTSVGVKKALLTVPVRKPSKEWFVRVHPHESYHLSTAVLELKEDRETYLVAPDLWPELAGEPTFSPRALFTTVNRQGVLFLWAVRLPGADGKIDEWSRSALDATQLAATRWVRVQADMGLGAYRVEYATGDLPEPVWPEASFRDLLKVAFRDRFIDRLDHPVLRRLRGEV
jgi:hypothetical protein